MQKISAAYEKEMQRLDRSETLPFIDIGVIDLDAAETAALSSSAGTHYSKLGLIVYENVPARTYATFEPGRWKCNGSQLVPPKNAGKTHFEGFVSNNVASNSKIFSNTYVKFSFSKKHTAPALTLTFDASANDYPALIEIIAYRDNSEIKRVASTPNAAVYIVDERFENFDRLDIYFKEARNANRRARLQNIMFGYGLVFTSNEIINLSQTMETDPISRRLPINDFDFTIENTEYFYNPDNPDGVWRDMELYTPVKITYGQRLSGRMSWADVNANRWGDIELNTWGTVYEGGFIERVPAGRYFLNAKPNADGLSATFQAFDVLSLAVGTYYKGKYGNRNLYSLALDVLNDAGLPPMPDGGVPWKIWNGLANFNTTAPLPVMAHRELLQLIANAACCVLYTDREGYIKIEPRNDEQHEFYLDFDAQTEKPKIEKTPAIAGVENKIYKYTVSKEEEVVFEETYSVNGSLDIHVDFSNSIANLRIAASGGTVASSLYANAADITLKGNGNVSIIIYGKKIEVSNTVVVSKVAKPAANAAYVSIENPLITVPAHGTIVAEWAKDYLTNRITYNGATRGYPETDPGDTVYFQSQFSEKFPVCILSKTLNYDGMLSETLIAKKIEN